MADKGSADKVSEKAVNPGYESKELINERVKNCQDLVEIIARMVYLKGCGKSIAENS